MTASKPKHRAWEFGPFCLNESERRLLRAGEPVPLSPKVFDTLVMLVERSGHLVEKAELIERLWPDTFVEEGTLTRNISDVRKALGDGRYVDTVPKRGYRFVAPVRVIDDHDATLIIEKTTESHLVIEEEKTTSQDGNYSQPSQVTIRKHTAPAGRSLRTRLAVMTFAGVLIVSIGYGVRELFKPRNSSDVPRRAMQAMQVSRFTSSGNVLSAAISPDGKIIATVLNEDGLQSLSVRQMVANTSSIRLTEPAMVDYWGLTFSNDSSFIYYVSWVRNHSDAELFQIPVLGGTPRRLPTVTDTPISFSPTGDRFAYVFSSSSLGESYVKLADIEGGRTQTLVKRKKPGFLTAWPGGPAWSPDGRFIAYAATDPASEGDRRVRVFVSGIEDNEQKQLTEQSWHYLGRVVWLSDASGLVISARDEMDAPRQLWFVDYPGGAARKITNDLHDYDSVSVTADTKTLAAVQTQEAFSVSVAPNGEKSPTASTSREGEAFFEVGSSRECLAWTEDNRIIYCSRASGNWDIWSMNPDGSRRRQLTFDPHNDLFPAVSSDGRFIFFASDRAATFNIWRMEVDGGNPTRLTSGSSQTLPEVTPDGQWVLYQQGLGPDEVSVWRVPASGGRPEDLAHRMAQRPRASPDGRSLAYVDLNDEGWGIVVRQLEGGGATQRLPFPSSMDSRFFRWTPDSKSLAYIANEEGASNIWVQPLSGEPPRRLTNFRDGRLIAFAWSPDGKQLAYLRPTSTSDVVLLSDLK